jgi:hypothetical protein
MLLDASEEGKTTGPPHLYDAYCAFASKLKKYYDKTGDLYWAGQFVNPADKLRLITEEFEKEAATKKKLWLEAVERATEQGRPRPPSQWHVAYTPKAENPISVLEKILSLLLAGECVPSTTQSRKWQVPVPTGMLLRVGSRLSEIAVEYYSKGQQEAGPLNAEESMSPAPRAVGEKRAAEGASSRPSKRHLLSWMQSRLNQNNRQEASPSEENPVEAEVLHYLAHPPPSGEAEVDLLAWYREHGAARFPRITKLAKWIFSIPSSSGGVERAFSSAGLDCTQRRHSLSSEKQAQLAMLRSHYEFIEKERAVREEVQCSTTSSCPCCAEFSA